jgi:hypothetical protein
VYAQYQTQTQGWSTYDDPILGISIQYPKGWEPTEAPNMLSFEACENETGLVVDATVGITPGPTMGLNTSEDVMKDNLNALRSSISEIYELNNKAKIGGITEPVSKSVHTFTNDEGEVIGRTIAYYVVSDDKAYSISFITRPTGYEKFIPTIQKMVDSFKILD